MTTIRKKQKFSLVKYIPGVIISSVIVIVLIVVIDFQEMVLAFQSYDLLLILLAFCVTIVSTFIRGLGWRALLEDRITTHQSFFIISEGYLLNNIIPRSGEIGRALIISEISEISFLHGLSTIFIERVFDICIAALMFIFTITSIISYDWIKILSYSILVSAIILFVIVVYVLRNRAGFEKKLEILSQKSPFVKKYISGNFKEVLEGLNVINNKTKLIQGLFWIIMSWGLWTVMYYLMLTQIENNPPFWLAIFAQSIIAMGIALPSAPASLGVYEGMNVAALSLYGITQENALSMALILHAIQIISTSTIGLIGFIIQGISLNDLFSKLKIRTEKKTTQKNEK